MASSREDGDLSVEAAIVDEIIVPPSIQALLAARVDRLTPEERTVLEAAAVVGQEFFVGAVMDLVPGDDRGHVRTDLLALVRKELIRPERSTLAGEDAFRFRHLLIRDSAYEAIPKAGARSSTNASPTGWSASPATRSRSRRRSSATTWSRRTMYRTQLGPADERSDAIARRAADASQLRDVERPLAATSRRRGEPAPSGIVDLPA